MIIYTTNKSDEISQTKDVPKTARLNNIEGDFKLVEYF